MLPQTAKDLPVFTASDDTAAASGWNSSLAEFPPVKGERADLGRVMRAPFTGGGFAGKRYLFGPLLGHCFVVL